MTTEENITRAHAARVTLDIAENALRTLALLEKGLGDAYRSSAATLRANMLDLIDIAEGKSGANWPEAARHFVGAYTEDRPQGDVRSARGL